MIYSLWFMIYSLWFIIYYSLFNIRYSLFIIHSSFFIIRYSLSIIHYLLFVINYLLFNIYFLLFIQWVSVYLKWWVYLRTLILKGMKYKTSVYGIPISLCCWDNIDQWYCSILKYLNIIGCLNEKSSLWHTNIKKIITILHGARALIQSLHKMISYPSMEKRRKNDSSGDADKAITKIQTGEISQAKAVHKYGIPSWTIAWKCKNKRENVV